MLVTEDNTVNNNNNTKGADTSIMENTSSG